MKLFVILLLPLGLMIWGGMVGIAFRYILSPERILTFGLIPLGCWLSSQPSWVPYTGLITVRFGHPITVMAGSGSAETVIWRSCRFVGALFRALKDLPGGLARFIPGGIGGNHRSVAMGLLVGLKESRSHALLEALLVLFGYK